MIVVEGCDGTGKTTLVQALVDDLGLQVGQRGTRNRDELWKVTREDTYRALAHAVEGYHPPYIWDRLGPFSDPIYSRIMGRECAFSTTELDYALRVMRAIRCPVIFCDVPLYVAKENQEKSHQMEGVSDNFPFIHGLYDGVIKAHQDWVIKYDYRVEGAYNELLGKVRSYCVKRKDREWH